MNKDIPNDPNETPELLEFIKRFRERQQLVKVEEERRESRDTSAECHE